MPFTTESARQARALRDGKAGAIDTVEAQVAREKAAMARLQRTEVERFYISSPLAHATEEQKATALKLELQVAPGPVAVRDEDGNVLKIIQREAGAVVLLEGEGVTTNRLWADYLKQEWPELEISEIPSGGLASYRQEIEDAKAALAGA